MSGIRLSFDIPTTIEAPAAFDSLSRLEWLTVNGIGGYASGTVAAANTRRYHGYLVPMLSHGRMTLLSKVEEQVTYLDQVYDLSANRYPNNTIHPQGFTLLTKFAPNPAPTWVYRLPGGTTLVKTLYLAHGKNTVYVMYDLPQGNGPVTLRLSPLVCWKGYHTEMHPFAGFPMRSEPLSDNAGWNFQALWDAPKMQLFVQATGAVEWRTAGWWNENIVHDRERERGFDFHENVYCPATAVVTLQVGQSVQFIGTIEQETPAAAVPAYRDTQRHLASVLKAAKLEATDAPLEQRALALNADQFLIQTPEGRHTLLAGYPWFTDWGRDTMIALPGLCLATGRQKIARQILADFSEHISEGMIPNLFPDEGKAPEYNTADATLWFVRACDLYVESSRDRKFQQEMLPKLMSIIEWHQKGTRFGIHVDPNDGLLSTGVPGSQLTWMDATVNGTPVTPRIGKVVEINALWIRALYIVAEWAGKKAGKPFGDAAVVAEKSFRERFVRPDGLGLYDFIAPDGKPNGSVRPNQVIAAAVCRTLLSPEEQRTVLEVATRELLTPVGLRTLSPADSAYRGRYVGGRNERDGAYHQGTVWPWLLGPYIDLYRNVHGEDADISHITAGILEHLAEFGIGGIAEIFDGDAPHRPNGCPWQAWSVAELLRVLRP